MKTQLTSQEIDKLTRNTDKLLMRILSVDIKKSKPREAGEMRLPVMRVA